MEGEKLGDRCFAEIGLLLVGEMEVFHEGIRIGLKRPDDLAASSAGLACSAVSLRLLLETDPLLPRTTTKRAFHHLSGLLLLLAAPRANNLVLLENITSATAYPGAKDTKSVLPSTSPAVPLPNEHPSSRCEQ